MTDGTMTDGTMTPARPTLPLPGWEDLLASFADFLRLDVAQGDASPETIRTYWGQVRQYLAWCDAWRVHPARATEEDLKAYRSWLVERYARATVATKLAAVRRFYAMAQARGYRPDNPAEGVKAPRDRTTREDRAKFLPLDGLRQLLVAPGRTLPDLPPFAVRDRAILALMGVHGLRVSEVARLDVGDVALEAGTLTVRGKGDKTRMIYLVDFSCKRLAAWMERRTDIAAEGETALFVAMDRARRFWGRRMTTRAIEALTDRYLEREGLKRPGISCHSLRHSAAVWARAFGASVDGLADMLGHASVDTTRVYARIVRRMEENPARFLEAALGADS